jgi:hypothetical protein
MAAMGPVASQRRRVFLSLLTALASLVLSLGAVELGLRAAGHRPWVYAGANARMPIMHEPDPVLGWRVKPGSYVAGPFARKGSAARLTFLPDGSRATGAPPDGADAPQLVLVGCSFTQGWAISDEETFAWRLRARFPAARVVNYGTAGYGTYQSLLRLERAFADGLRPRLVVYGFIGNHEIRNVATPLWLRLQAFFSLRGTVDVPYVSSDGGDGIVRHPPERHPEWPLKERLASVAWLEARYLDFTGRHRQAQARPATERLLVEMDALSKRHGAHLIVALLHFAREDEAAKGEYVRMLAARGIDFADCSVRLTRENTVPGDFHPNADVNAGWADCLAAKLGEELGKSRDR